MLVRRRTREPVMPVIVASGQRPDTAPGGRRRRARPGAGGDGRVLRGPGLPSLDQPTATTRAAATPPPPPATVTKTVPSVPETCEDTADLADEVISRLTRNIRDNRLAEVLRDYTIASQACRREASP